VWVPHAPGVIHKEHVPADVHARRHSEVVQNHQRGVDKVQDHQSDQLVHHRPQVQLRRKLGHVSDLRQPNKDIVVFQLDQLN